MTESCQNVYRELHTDHPEIMQRIVPIATALIGTADVGIHFSIKDNLQPFETKADVTLTGDDQSSVVTFGYATDSAHFGDRYTSAELDHNFRLGSAFTEHMLCVKHALVSTAEGLRREKTLKYYALVTEDGVTNPVLQTQKVTYHRASKWTVIAMARVASKLITDKAIKV